MTTVKHVQSTDYPNGKAVTAAMFAYDDIIRHPLRHGERVEIIVGGHRGTLATVRSLYNDYLSLTADSGIILSGFHVSNVRRVGTRTPSAGEPDHGQPSEVPAVRALSDLAAAS